MVTTLDSMTMILKMMILKMTILKMTILKMTILKMTVLKMTVLKMTVLKMTFPIAWRTLRRWMIPLVLLLGAVFCEAWLYQGWLVPRRVTGGSMATYLIGRHYPQSCGDCRFSWVRDAQEVADITCPNCGWTEAITPQQGPRQGDRLLIRGSFLTHATPRRWETVAIRSPNAPTDVAVKRLVGLPHEQVAIVDGDVFIDGHIARKNWRQIRQMAILVHDANHSPPSSSGLPLRWQATNHDAWRSGSAGFTWQGSPIQNKVGSPALEKLPSDPSWLTYQHLGCAGPIKRRKPTAITDNYAYNQNVSRNLQLVRDVLVTCNIKAMGQGRLGLRCHDGFRQRYLLWHPAAGKIELQGGDGPAEQFDVSPWQFSDEIEVAFGTCDRQLFICVNDHELLKHPYDHDGSRFSPVSSPVALLPVGWQRLEVTRLKVWRDLYYLGLPGQADTKSVPLGVDDYFVLGDNSPISIDSRQWSNDGHALLGNNLLGRALRYRSSR